VTLIVTVNLDDKNAALVNIVAKKNYTDTKPLNGIIYYLFIYKYKMLMFSSNFQYSFT